MAKKGTLVVRFIGDTKEFDQANKKMGTGLAKTGKAIDSSLTQPLGKASSATGQLGKDFDASQRKMATALSNTKRNIDSDLTQPLDKASMSVQGLGNDVRSELGKVDKALDGTGTAVKGLTRDFSSETKRIESLIGGTRQEVKQFEKDVKDIKVKVGFDDDQAEQGMDGFFSNFKGAAATGGAAAGAVLVAALWDAIGVEADVDRVAAQLGLGKRQSARLGQVAGEIFGSNWAASVGEAAAGVGAVLSSIPGISTGSKSLEDLSSKALAFADLFEVDVARGAQIAGQAIRTGLAKNGSQAFDLLFRAAQKVPANVREDVLDALDEYSVFFETLGLNGPQAFGLLVEGAKQGMYGIDKTGDALKEFTLLAQDTAKKPLFAGIGLNFAKVSTMVAEGGDKGAKAIQMVVDALLRIKDPGEQARTAIALFGTPLEDLGVHNIPAFLKALDNGGAAMRDFKGTAEKSMSTMSDNVQGDFKTLVNGLRQGGQDLIAGLFSGDWGRMFDGLKQIWENVKSVFKEYWRQILVVSSLGLGLIILAIHDNWGKISGWFKAQWDKITGFFKGGWNTVKNLTSDAWDKITGYFKNTSIDQIIRDLMNLIPNLIGKGMDKAKDLFFDALKWIGRKIADVDWVKLLGDIMGGIKRGVGAAWDWVKGKVSDTLGNIGQKIQDIRWGEILDRMWDGIKKVFRSAGSAVIGIVRNFIADVVDKFLGFVQWFLEAADKAFGWIPGVGDKLDGAVEDFKRFREGVNNQIKGIDSSKSIALHIIPDKKFQQIVDSGAGHPAWTGNRATGGAIEGGKRGRDSVPIMAMPGEHVWTASEVRNVGGHGKMKQLRTMAKQGALQPMAKGGPIERSKGVYPELVGERQALKTTGAAFRGINQALNQIVMLVRQSAVFPAGRVGDALRWARSQVGKPYVWGGVGPGGYDCSGFMSAITNFLRGKSIHSRVGSTGTFPWPGFVPGADPRGFTIGSTISYPGSGIGHMAGTLGGINVESSGGVGVRVGKGARGFRDPGFNQVFHLAGIKGGTRVRGGDTGALSKGEKYIIMREAGGLFNVNANNPSSSAFGLGQLLEANRIKYASRLGFNAAVERGDTGTTDRDKQIAMFRAYYRDRYGGINRAVAFHKAHGWYDNGGILPPGITIAHNNTGRNEYVSRERPGARPKVFEARITNWNDGVIWFQEISRENAREEIREEFRHMGSGV